MQSRFAKATILVNQGHSTRTRQWWSRSTSAAAELFMLVRQLIERLGWRALSTRYACSLQVVPGSDHILTLIFSMFSGGNKAGRQSAGPG